MTLSLKWKAELIYHVTKSCNLIGMHCTVWQDKLMYGRECCHMSSPWLCYIVWPKTVSSHFNVLELWVRNESSIAGKTGMVYYVLLKNQVMTD